MRSIDKQICLEISSRNLQRAFKDYGIGPAEAAQMLRELIDLAREQIANGGLDYQKGVSLLRFCYEKLESFMKHVEGTKIDIGDQSAIDSMSSDELDKLLADISE